MLNLSCVPSKVFAASLTSDRQTVTNKLPSNTQELCHSGVTGWLYQITSQLGDDYTLFVYNDGSQYQVLVVFPEILGHYHPHEAHFYPHGLIDLGSPQMSLESAYAKSVLWTNSFSIFVRTGEFPFSINNIS